MNTERRHDLETNTLAKGLNTWSDKLRPYTSAMLLAVAVLLGIYIVASLWNSYQATRDRAAWDDYQLAVFQDDAESRSLQRLADSEDHQGTTMQEWALVGWADRQLRLASQQYLSNREEALERLTDVTGVFRQFAETGSTAELRNRARLGLARVSEMKNDLKEARAQYARVEGALAAIAAERIKELESTKVADTATWLATVKLLKPTPPRGPGTPGARPGLEATLPPTEDVGAAMEEILGGLGAEGDATRYDEADAPEAGEGSATPPAGETATGEPPAAESSEAPAATPETEPAAATPAAEQPAATAPPATEPAAEAPAEPPAPAAGAPAEQ